MFYEPHDHGLPHNPFKSLVVPRPIGWISTVSTDGVPNLAPYSFFNAASEKPPIVMFCAGSLPGPRTKDSRINAEETGEFVFNMAAESLTSQMNDSSGSYPPEVDEFDHAGLTKAPCRKVKAPRVGESPIAFECEYLKTVELPNDGEKTNAVVFGTVVGIHIDESIIGEDGLVDVLRFRPLARLGYWQYTVVDNVFTMLPPD
jgi:flavin reductase (DIM6/NTAB) family NADH-FMN oxidoreductase RutF